MSTVTSTGHAWQRQPENSRQSSEFDPPRFASLRTTTHPSLKFKAEGVTQPWGRSNCHQIVQQSLTQIRQVAAKATKLIAQEVKAKV